MQDVSYILVATTVLEVSKWAQDLKAEVDALGLLDGRSALHCAAAAGDAQCLKRLLLARGDPQRRDQLRMLPLDVAARVHAEEAQEAGEVSSCFKR